MADDPLATGRSDPFPDSASRGSASWDSFRAKQDPGWDAALARVNGEIDHVTPSARAPAPAEPASFAARAPAAPPPSGSDGNAPAAGASGVVMARLSNPDTLAKARLPEQALNRYIELRDIGTDASAIVMAIGSDISEAITRRQEASVRLAHLERDVTVASGQGLRPDQKEHPAVAEEKRKIAEANGEIERLEKRKEPHARLMSATRFAVQNIVDPYIRDASGGGLVLAKPVKLNAKDSLDIVAERIQSIRADIDAIAAAPWPSSDAKVRATREVEFLAGIGRVDVRKSVLSRSQLGWPAATYQGRDRITLRGYGRGMGDIFDTRAVSVDVALIAWIHKDELIAKLHAAIDEEADDENALSDRQRGERYARLYGQLLAEQRVMSEIIWRDASHHLWPADLDPRAVLGVDGPEPRQD